MIGDRWATYTSPTGRLAYALATPLHVLAPGSPWSCALCGTWHRDECTHPLARPR